MVSDAVHSLSDVLSTFVVILGVKLSSKLSDDDHQYGHERLESVMAIVLSIMLLVVGLEIGQVGVKNLINYKSVFIAIPSVINVIAAIVSILVKEMMYWVTYLVGKKVNSSMLKADAWHHRSDALSSVGSLIGVLGARYGYIWLDSVASLVICLFILKIAFDIFKESVDKLVDKACDKTTEKNLISVAKSVKGVEHVDDIKTRIFADKIYVDMEICVDGSLTVSQGHYIAENVHESVESFDSRIKHCTVHVNPIIK
jgi:cation diffusion facilitator family transporter